MPRRKTFFSRKRAALVTHLFFAQRLAVAIGKRPFAAKLGDLLVELKPTDQELGAARSLFAVADLVGRAAGGLTADDVTRALAYHDQRMAADRDSTKK